MFLAGRVGDQPRLAALVARDPALVSAFSPLGWQPLAYAAFGGNAAAMTFLLGKGADVNARASTRFRNTPLQIGLLCNEAGSAKLLLERGADPNIRQNGDFVALHEAASIGRTDIMELLVDHGAELSPRSAKGETPLAVATRKGKADAVTWLKARGAKD
jgi:ankyrin repeat protein